MPARSLETRRYHESQYDKPYESTSAMQDFIVSVMQHPNLKGRVLDVGCGAGANIHWCDTRGLTRHAEVIGIDNDPLLLEIARQRNPTRDFACLDFRDPLPKCDTVLSWQVLSFIEDWRPALREIMNALDPGGYLFASSLFWTGVDVHSHASDGDKVNVHYNVISREMFSASCLRWGGEVVKWRPFYAQQPLYAPFAQLRSRTYEAMTFSGPLYLPWTFVAVRKSG